MSGATDETHVPGPRPGSVDDAQEATLPGEARRADEGGRVPRGTVVGRYVVLSELGAGAMGRVYAAYDPKLDRRVALKVLRLHRGRDGVQYQRAERRLLREAQALAKLSHPNVVTVHDVESLHGSLVVAMDFIEGRTLRRWLAEAQRSWSEVVRVLLGAGEGLAAAHRAGLVHRDFKPDNVMVSADDRAHVVDFGLAQAFEPAHGSEDDASVELEEPALAEVGEATEHTGSRGRAGTPAYMAPEQHVGRGVGPASDQFAFCVVLYEALFGQRPFEGKTLLALTTAVFEGRVVPPPREADVPLRIRDAVVRGLAVEPERRHADMDALLAALRFDPGARRRRMLTLAGGIGLVGVAAAGWLDAGTTSPSPCEGGREKLMGVWDEATREVARAAVLGTGLAYAEHGWEQAVPHLDRWTDQWVEMHDDACAATRLRGEQSEARLDLRMVCLEGHRQRLAATAAVLAEADAGVVERVLPLATGLPPVSECGDVAALEQAVPPPRDPALRERVVAVRATLARAETLGLAGKYAQGMAAASEATDVAARLGYAPLHAEALLQRGWLEDKQGDAAAAELTLSAAAWEAERARHDAVAARATSELAFVVGSQLERIDEGLQWARHADAAAARSGDPLAQARMLNNRAMVLTTGGRYAEAEVDLRRALGLRERLLEPEHADIASTRTNLGIVLDDLGRKDEALAIYDEVLAERERTLGPDHPRVAALLTNSAHVLAMEGRPEQALPRIHRAIAIYRTTFGPQHPELASAYNNLATVLFVQDDYEGAVVALGDAIEIWRIVREPNHPDLGDAYFNMGALEFEVERSTAARESFERALAIFEAAYGPDHPDVALTLLNLGIVDRSEGALVHARERHLRTVEIFRAAMPADHPDLARGLTNLARDCLGLEYWSEALAAAEEARRIHVGRDEGELALEAEFLIARAHWAAGEDRAAALAEARHALAGVGDDELRQEIAQWLAGVGASPLDG